MNFACVPVCICVCVCVCEFCFCGTAHFSPELYAKKCAIKPLIASPTLALKRIHTQKHTRAYRSTLAYSNIYLCIQAILFIYLHINISTFNVCIESVYVIWQSINVCVWVCVYASTSKLIVPLMRWSDLYLNHQNDFMQFHCSNLLHQNKFSFSALVLLLCWASRLQPLWLVADSWRLAFGRW